MDETIIPKRLAQKKQSHRNIYDDEVYVDNETLHFISTKLFDSNARIMLPDTFVDMPALLAETKYPSVYRPHIIKTNPSGAVNFCFNLFQSPIKAEQIEEACLGFRSILQRVQPSLMFLEHKKEELTDKNLSWFDFRSYSLDQTIYNLFFVTSIDGKLMNGVFNCANVLKDEWQSIAKQVLLSIEDYNLEENHA